MRPVPVTVVEGTNGLDNGPLAIANGKIHGMVVAERLAKGKVSVVLNIETEIALSREKNKVLENLLGCTVAILFLVELENGLANVIARAKDVGAEGVQGLCHLDVKKAIAQGTLEDLVIGIAVK